MEHVARLAPALGQVAKRREDVVRHVAHEVVDALELLPLARAALGQARGLGDHVRVIRVDEPRGLEIALQLVGLHAVVLLADIRDRELLAQRREHPAPDQLERGLEATSGIVNRKWRTPASTYCRTRATHASGVPATCPSPGIPAKRSRVAAARPARYRRSAAR